MKRDVQYTQNRKKIWNLGKAIIKMFKTTLIYNNSSI